MVIVLILYIKITLSKFLQCINYLLQIKYISLLNIYSFKRSLISVSIKRNKCVQPKDKTAIEHTPILLYHHLFTRTDTIFIILTIIHITKQITQHLVFI